MTHIYYFLTIILFCHELKWIFSPKEEVENSKYLENLRKQNKYKKYDDYSIEYKNAIKDNMYLLLMFIWLFLGFFTFQWDAFLIFLIISTTISLLSKPFKYNKFYVIIHWLSSLIGVAFSIFVVLNKYHLHISLFQELKKLL